MIIIEITAAVCIIYTLVIYIIWKWPPPKIIDVPDSGDYDQRSKDRFYQRLSFVIFIIFIGMVIFIIATV